MFKREGGRIRPSLMPDSQSALMDVNDLASHLRVSIQTVRRMVADGRLPPPLRCGRLLRWDWQAVSKFIDEKFCGEGRASR
jgi:predicted DNA-binding transcriptional regulator AlpA